MILYVLLGLNKSVKKEKKTPPFGDTKTLFQKYCVVLIF